MIGPYLFPPKLVWTNAAQSFLKVQALTKGWSAPGVAGAFACVFLLGGLGRGK